MSEDQMNDAAVQTEAYSNNNDSIISISGDVNLVTNHTSYDYSEAANFEHDTNASIINYSGCVDMVFNAFAENECWEEGYDY